MSSIILPPSSAKGTVVAPASKSMAQRAIIAAALAFRGLSVLRGFTECSDSLAAIAVAKQLGVQVEQHNSTLNVQGGIRSVPPKLGCSESGLLARMLAPILATQKGTAELTGEGSLLLRPFSFVEDALVRLGACCKSTAGFLPLKIKGPILGGNITIDGSLSSQLLTGLLFALPLCENDSIVQVTNLNSRPYIDMTVDLLHQFGIVVEHDSYHTFFIRGGQEYRAATYTIEGDWSGAACLLVYGAISGDVCVKGLNMHSLQADRAIVDVLIGCGAAVEYKSGGLYVSKDQLNPFQLNATHCPDLFPALAVLASACKGTSKIEGVARLRYKESDRAAALQTELAKLGVEVNIVGDTMEVVGKGRISGGQVFAHNDHRMAMALAVASGIANSAIEVKGVACVAKSYPTFFNDLALISRL